MNDYLTKIKHFIDVPSKRRFVKYIGNLVLSLFSNQEEITFEGWDISYPEIKFIYYVNGRNYYCTLRLSCVNEKEFFLLDEELSSFVLSFIGLSFLPRHFSLGDFDIVKSNVPLSRHVIGFFEESLVLTIAEQRYRDGRDPTKPVKIICEIDGSDFPLLSNTNFKEKILILNGGGKDTVVAVEICKTLGIDMALFSVNLENGKSLGASQGNIAKFSEIEEHHNMEIYYGEELYENHKYSMEGLPYLMSFSFLGILPAIIHGYSYIVSGNEFSSNFGNVKFKGMDINHQYNKSYEYERLLNNLIKEHISKDLNVFSILRPFHDVQLAKLFSKHVQYFNNIVSCNIDPINWCKKCPKCAFTYIACLAFIDKDNIKSIFDSNYLEDPVIRREIMELTTKKLKPWDCVGTQEESQLALRIILEKYPDMEFDNWPMRKDLEFCCRNIDLEKELSKYLDSYNNENLIPDNIEKQIKNKYLNT